MVKYMLSKYRTQLAMQYGHRTQMLRQSCKYHKPAEYRTRSATYFLNIGSHPMRRTFQTVAKMSPRRLLVFVFFTILFIFFGFYWFMYFTLWQLSQHRYRIPPRWRFDHLEPTPWSNSDPSYNKSF